MQKLKPRSPEAKMGREIITKPGLDGNVKSRVLAQRNFPVFKEIKNPPQRTGLVKRIRT
jgi:hypothetical protein